MQRAVRITRRPGVEVIKIKIFSTDICHYLLQIDNNNYRFSHNKAGRDTHQM